MSAPVSAGTIAEFLASVGFKADAASLKSALAKVAGFGLGVKLITVGICAGLTRVATAEADIARQAGQLRTSSERLQELGYVAEQSGAGIDAVTRSIDSLISKNPRIKDGARALEVAGERMRGMSEIQRKAYASRMGIDPTLIPALTGDVAKLKDEFRAMYAVAGTDAKQAAEASKGFLAELGKLRTLAAMLARAVAVVFMDKIRRDIEQLRKSVMEHFGAIKAVLEFVIAVILRVSSVISAMVYRAIKTVSGLVDRFGKLAGGQKKLIIGAGLLLAAWRLLNLGFLATPLGMLLVGLTALVGLVDDYLTYMDGGRSRIDWGPWVDTIERAREALSRTVDMVTRFVANNGELIGVLGKSLGVWFGLRKGIGLVGGAVRLLTTGVKGLSTALKGNLIGLLLYLAVTVVMLIIEHWSTIKEFFAGLWQGVEDAAAKAAASLKAAWQAAKDWIVGAWGDVERAFPNFARYAGSALALFRAFGRLIVALFTGNFTEAGEQLRVMLSSWGDMATAALSGLASIITGIFGSAWDAVRNSFPNFAGWAESSAAALRNILGAAADWVKGKLADLVQWMPDWVKDRLGITSAPQPGQDKPQPERSCGAPVPSGSTPASASGAAPGLIASLSGEIKGAFAGLRAFLSDARPALQAVAVPAPALIPSPAGAAALDHAATTNTNVKLDARTEIHMHTADPVAAGNQVAERQGQVNADLVRNARGAAR